MSTSRNARRNAGRAAPPASGRKLPRAAAVVVAIAVVAVLGLWWSTSRHDDSTAPPTGATSAPPAAVAEDPAAFQKLKGRWVRVDAGYVVEIRSVEAGGRVDAAYFDPRPIHVARARASQEGGSVKLYIELRDVNDPGSTYRLRYNAGRDILEGTYFQGIERQMYDVSFMRR